MIGNDLDTIGGLAHISGFASQWIIYQNKAREEAGEAIKPSPITVVRHWADNRLEPPLTQHRLSDNSSEDVLMEFTSDSIHKAEIIGLNLLRIIAGKAA